MHGSLRRAVRARRDELAFEVEARVAGGVEEVVAIQHPAEVLGFVPVYIGVLGDDESRRHSGDRQHRNVEPRVRRRRQALQQQGDVARVLERVARDDEVVGALEARVVVVERALRKQLAAERGEARQVTGVVLELRLGNECVRSTA